MNPAARRGGSPPYPRIHPVFQTSRISSARAAAATILVALAAYLPYTRLLYGASAAVVPVVLNICSVILMYSYSGWLRGGDAARYWPLAAAVYAAPLAVLGLYSGYGLNTLYISPLNAILGIAGGLASTAAVELYRLGLYRALGGVKGFAASTAAAMVLIYPYGSMGQGWIACMEAAAAASYSIYAAGLAAAGGASMLLPAALAIRFLATLAPILPDAPRHIWLTASVISAAAGSASIALLTGDGKRRSRGRGLAGILFTLLLAVSAIAAVAGLLSGHRAFVVMTGSMEPELMPGDVVVAAPRSTYSVGDIVVFVVGNTVVVHRIDGVSGDSIYTRGDANKDRDPWVIGRGDIVGAVDHRLPGIGIPFIALARFSGSYVNALLSLTALIGLVYTAFTSITIIHRYTGVYP